MSLQIEIKGITAVPGEPYVSVRVEITGEETEKRTLIIPADAYIKLKLRRGITDEKTFNIIEDEAKTCSAMRRGGRLLGYGANSKKTMTRKLCARGYDREVAERAAEKLAAGGYINENSDAQNEARRCLAKLWGERRIIAHLCQKGYGDEPIEGVRAMLGTVDFAENCGAMIRKKFGTLPQARAEREKMTAALIRYGYSISDIRAAIKLIEPRK